MPELLVVVAGVKIREGFERIHVSVSRCLCKPQGLPPPFCDAVPALQSSCAHILWHSLGFHFSASLRANGPGSLRTVNSSPDYTESFSSSSFVALDHWTRVSANSQLGFTSCSRLALRPLCVSALRPLCVSALRPALRLALCLRSRSASPVSLCVSLCASLCVSLTSRSASHSRLAHISLSFSGAAPDLGSRMPSSGREGHSRARRPFTGARMPLSVVFCTSVARAAWLHQQYRTFAVPIHITGLHIAGLHIAVAWAAGQLRPELWIKPTIGVASPFSAWAQSARILRSTPPVSRGP